MPHVVQGNQRKERAPGASRKCKKLYPNRVLHLRPTRASSAGPWSAGQHSPDITSVKSKDTAEMSVYVQESFRRKGIGSVLAQTIVR